MKHPSPRLPSPRFSRHGFTLVELSIVLVIIGLLVGAIVVGQSLIRASEVNSMSSDIQRYRSAFNQFRLKYNYFPGDLPHAFDYWPLAGCLNAAAVTPPSTGCNGDGNGVIAAWNGTGSETVENYRAWQQLALSGMIPGRYSGQPGPASAGDDVIGVNVPTTRITGVGIRLDRVFQGGDAFWFNGDYPNGFSVGLDSTQFADATGSIYREFLTPAETQSVDNKYDDGRPGVGKYRTRDYSADCVTATGAAAAETAAYNLTFVGIACNLRIDLE